MNVREIHSRKPQLYRTRISDEFKESKRLILITSDVSARGMNYPDVTLVIQVLITHKRLLYYLLHVWILICPIFSMGIFRILLSMKRSCRFRKESNSLRKKQ